MTPASQVPQGPVCHVHAPPPVKAASELRTRWVTVLTAAMMVAELVAGYSSHSLALTADGWHMMTHVGAIGLSALAYWYARTRAAETRFAFGTGKVYALSGYTSAGMLLAVAASMAWSAVERFMHPEVVDFAEAFPIAVVGLVVNLASAALLDVHDDDHDHHHGAGHDHAQEHHHHDQNLKAAYLHVVADALTSVAAIAALVAGRYFNVGWMDPVVAIAGSVLIVKWAVGLVGESARQLVDLDPSTTMRDRVRTALEAVEGTLVDDLHLWRVGPGAVVCVVSVSSFSPRTLREYKELVMASAPVNHLTIEICTRGGATG